MIDRITRKRTVSGAYLQGGPGSLTKTTLTFPERTLGYPASGPGSSPTGTVMSDWTKVRRSVSMWSESRS